MHSRVEIITSVYAGKKYIEKFLRNITAQTAFGECELFLLGANSPDEEYESAVISEFQKSYGNIRYERLTEDPGLYNCWNMMIKNSDSEFITNANLDDRLHRESIERHLSLLKDEPSIDVAYCLNYVSDKHIDDIDDGSPDLSFDIFPTSDFSIYALSRSNLPHNHPMWRRSIHKTFGYFSDEFVSGSDWEFWLRCAYGGSKMKLIQEKLGFYYRNPKGISTDAENMERNINEVRVIYERYRKISRDMGWSANQNKPQPSGLACPECGNQLVDVDSMILLLSDPPKKKISCTNCGYTGCSVA